MKKGRLFLVPSPLGENDPFEVIPPFVAQAIKDVTYFVVEEVRTARRYLSKIGFRGKIDSLHFYQLNEHSIPEDAAGYIQILLDGNDVALISEAGLPAVADPGSILVEYAHRNCIEVIPFVGPSSLMLALMGSGFNGQCFAFNGYIPIKKEERKSKLKEMERSSSVLHQTQIFIETPYRNDSLLADILSICNENTMLCIAADITLPTATIMTKRIGEWGKLNFQIGKRPCVFLLSV